MREFRVLGTLVLVLVLPFAACSESARHRVLSFLFDGVPEPGAVPFSGYAVEDHRMGAASSTGEAPAAPVSSHPPFRENRCDACHNRADGQTYRPVAEGLCQSCHAELSRAADFVHGPVAVNACDQCHHHHASTHPGMLLDQATALCFRCHEEEDLTTGTHHDDIAGSTCVLCHDPHGGSNRFFVKLEPP